MRHDGDVVVVALSFLIPTGLNVVLVARDPFSNMYFGEVSSGRQHRYTAVGLQSPAGANMLP